MTQVDKENIIYWFERIEQIAGNKKALNGIAMQDSEAFSVIKKIAKNSIYYIKNHCL